AASSSSSGFPSYPPSVYASEQEIRSGTRGRLFAPVIETGPNVHGVDAQGAYQSITVMKEYIDKSLEELRLEDEASGIIHDEPNASSSTAVGSSSTTFAN